MQKRRVGKTSLEVSVIGLGTVKLGRNQGVKYPATFSLPSDRDIEQLLDTAAALGINLLDTAPAYGCSEERLGDLLHGKRHDWVISTKAGETFVDGKSYYDFSAQSIQASVEDSLRRLRTDYLDIVFAHSNGDDQSLIEEENVFTTLAALKKSGKIRAYGMSTKTVQGGRLTVEMADVAMVTFNPHERNERDVITYACEKHKGIFIKKALASGHLQTFQSQDPILSAMQFVFAEPGVTSVIVGTLNPDHLRGNVERAEQVLGVDK